MLMFVLGVLKEGAPFFRRTATCCTCLSARMCCDSIRVQCWHGRYGSCWRWASSTWTFRRQRCMSCNVCPQSAWKSIQECPTNFYGIQLPPPFSCWSFTQTWVTLRISECGAELFATPLEKECCARWCNHPLSLTLLPQKVLVAKPHVRS